VGGPGGGEEGRARLAYRCTRILISADELKTLPVGVQDLFHAALIDWGLIMAGGVEHVVLDFSVPAVAEMIGVLERFAAEGRPRVR
jgi:hypothetical protein